jgi:D-glycero-D-manno-heptose 1,7-bisphosphate phosphatase
MRRAVFLDRDGVLNRVKLLNGLPKPPTTIHEIIILEGVCQAVDIILNKGFVPVIITNQPDVARGKISQSEVDSINSQIQTMTNIDFVYTCFHDDADLCYCRKPSPGLIYQAANELNLDIKGSFLVGDRWRDIQAGQVAGCQNFFIDNLYPELRPNQPYTRVSSLLEAANLITGVPYEDD